MNSDWLNNRISRVGEISKSKFGTEMKIIEYNNSRDVLIRFLDKNGIEKHVSYCDFVKGRVKNPYDKSLYGEGFIGEGFRSRINGRREDAHAVWLNMLRRCYSGEKTKDFESYKNCKVSDEWKNYSNFALWYNSNKYLCSNRLEIDKDILISGNKIYSKDTCILIPQEINGFCQLTRFRGGCLTQYHTWRCVLGHKEKQTYIGTFKTQEEAKIAFLEHKNKIFQELIEKYKKELPEELYFKLKNTRLDICYGI